MKIEQTALQLHRMARIELWKRIKIWNWWKLGKYTHNIRPRQSAGGFNTLLDPDGGSTHY